MTKKTEFHAVDFFRKIRDKQAATLSGKPPSEIIAFFKQTKPGHMSKPEAVKRRVSGRRDR